MLCLSLNAKSVAFSTETHDVSSSYSHTMIDSHSNQPIVEQEALVALQYFLDEVENDPLLTHEQQHEKIQEFKTFADSLSPEVSSLLTQLLLEETRLRISDILNHAALEDSEIDHFLEDYEQAIHKVENMTVEIAREMLFFVAELKIHRQFIYEFGVALGCPEKQLLRHDLCKLCVDQFEGYARYFRGGKQESDKLAYQKAWGAHQYEEHHLESYSKEGFNFANFSEERLRNNMLEAVADGLAATKQRGGCTLLEWLVTRFPKSNPHPRLLPYLEEGLIKAHSFYLENQKNPDINTIFKDFPCWNQDVEEVFKNLKETAKY